LAALVGSCCVSRDLLVALQLARLLQHVLSVFHYNILGVLVGGHVLRARPSSLVGCHPCVSRLGALIRKSSIGGGLAVRHVVEVDLVNISLVRSGACHLLGARACRVVLVHELSMVLHHLP